jgi:hypothetical protein
MTMDRRQARGAFSNIAAFIGGVLLGVLVETTADAQAPRPPLNTLNDLWAALQACWIPPPLEQSRTGMQVTVMMSFKRNGELFGHPKITFESVEASDDERLAYRIAVADMLKRCAPLPFTEGLGNAIAGRPFTMRFVDSRKMKKAEYAHVDGE